MSSFLVNLARRGAGLPATTIQAPPPSPFGPEIRKQGDELTEAHEAARGLRMAEEPATGNAASQAPLPASSSEEPMELPSEAPIHRTLSIQRLSGTESSSSPIQASIGAIGEPAATASAPSLGPPPVPRQHVIPDRREAQATPMEPPKPLGPAIPPFHSDHEVITEVGVEGDRHTTSTMEPEDKPRPQTHSAALASPSIINEPDEMQVVSPEEPSADGPWVGVQNTRQNAREPALPAPTIRPALAESHTLLQFQKIAPASSPTPPAQLPIHVRIGRVEVRAATAPTPTPARPSPPASLGFDGYYRVRTYRS